MGKVNSESYWDDRFKDDWVENSGDKQSQFFMNLAFEMLPDWLTKTLQKGTMTVCDWGCAEGDGTNMLARQFPKTNFTGIDFADTAIEKANGKYKEKNLSFEAVDLLTQAYDKKFDIIFSSNVFEHFEDPWSTFDKVSSFANDVFIMMVPYKEDPDKLIPEHFHSFNEADFRFKTDNWELVYFIAKDVSRLQDTHWFGNQAMAVFVSKEFAKKFSLTIADVLIDSKIRHAITAQQGTGNIEQMESMADEIIKLRNLVEAHEGVLNSKRVKLANKIADSTEKLFPKGSTGRKMIGGAINKVITRNKK